MDEIKSVYLAPEGFTKELEQELSLRAYPGTRLVSSPESARMAVWAQDIWFDPRIIKITSINDAVRKLKPLARFWTLHATELHRRAALIQSQLRSLKIVPVQFPECPDLQASGVWALLDAGTIIASPRRWKRFPDGVVLFSENKRTPPNRAYLKLWEAITLMNERPQKGALCVDLGSSPGGWTWVLQSLGAQVLSVDKAPLDPRIRKIVRVKFLQQSAFALDPLTLESVDWLVCDVACYPERLYALIQRWLAAGRVRRMICTIKLQGKTDFAKIERFKQIPGAQVLHLSQNKHELTWIWPALQSLTIPSID